MAIERRLTEIVGPVGGRVHTARSRNDQVATDLAMFVRAHSMGAREAVLALMRVRGRSWPRRTSTGRCPATPIFSAPSPSISRTTCWPTSGSFAGITTGSVSA